MERMTDVEALMWTLEKDPHLGSAFANVTVFDRPVDVERLRRRLAGAVNAVPRLRQRVVPGLGRIAPPAWADDPHFDLDRHLRRIALPQPGTERQLFDLAARLAAEPFDRTRPLWRFTVVDGLDGGRSAMVQQLHHTITDGEGGVRMSLSFIDLERDAPEPDVPPAPAGDGDGDDGLLALATSAAGHVVRRGAGIGLRTAGEAVGLVRHPTRVAAYASGMAATSASLLRQVPTDPARSPLWTARSLGRHLEVLRVPVADAKRVAHALGGSVNDLFVAAVAGGAGRYHRDRGADVDELRMAMPVSTRVKGGPATSNAFAPTRTLVPVGPDPRARFEAIRDRLTVTKTERALGVVAGLAGVMNLVPTAVLVRVARAQVETVDFTTSNVRGAPFDLYIAGARIDANYPLGPVAGTAFNATTLSVAGSLDIGIHVDTGAVEDPRALRDAIDSEFAALLSLA